MIQVLPHTRRMTGLYRIVFFIGCFLAGVNHSHAQEKNVFGIILGLNASNVSNYNGNTSVGLTGGLYWEWKLSNTLSLQSNFLYSERGERENWAIPKLRLHYIHLPIMAKYVIVEDFQAMLGIYIDPLLGVTGDTYSMEDLRNNDFGVPLGVSYNISDNLQLGLSYGLGIATIFTTSSNHLLSRNNWGGISITRLIN